MTVWPSVMTSPTLMNGSAPGSGDMNTVPTIGDTIGVPVRAGAASAAGGAAGAAEGPVS